jgi:hypothetical protein
LGGGERCTARISECVSAFSKGITPSNFGDISLLPEDAADSKIAYLFSKRIMTKVRLSLRGLLAAGQNGRARTLKLVCRPGEPWGEPPAWPRSHKVILPAQVARNQSSTPCHSLRTAARLGPGAFCLGVWLIRRTPWLAIGRRTPALPHIRKAHPIYWRLPQGTTTGSAFCYRLYWMFVILKGKLGSAEGDVAQLVSRGHQQVTGVEQPTLDRKVAGSSPVVPISTSLPTGP